MPLFQVRNTLNSVVTAAVLCYSHIGAPAINPVNFSSNIEMQVEIPPEMNFDYYQEINRDQAVIFKQIDIIHQFASNLLDNIKELDPEYSKTVDENFWDLI